ncbi:MAG: exodeoxyribonuclease III [Alphaproteobacteria bacterium]|nr:exodeoxyribonuclease III [Alphaproteobacteria bacterium]
MTRLSLATWNINSIRLRIDRVVDFVKRQKPDVVCLQEIKCQTGEFPRTAFEACGLPYLEIAGQKGMHGVAIASRYPLQISPRPDFCRHDHARVCSVEVEGFTLHNLYVPAGADIPDPGLNDKFAHKLDFLERMTLYYSKRARTQSSPLLVVGDINIAPEENDVWSHRQLLDVVSHTPVETDGLKNLLNQGELSDVARVKHSPEEKLYTWWSYRAADWRSSNRGRRLDHIWADRSAILRTDVNTYTIHQDERDGEKPSDHVPVSVEIVL